MLGLLWVCALTACASDGPFERESFEEATGDDVPAERAGLGFTREGALERPTPVGGERARQAEAARVVRELWEIAGASGAPGEAWTFDYQVHGGALTLLSFRRTTPGLGAGAAVDWNGFSRELTRSLSTLVGVKPRRLRFTLERGPERWRFDLETIRGQVAAHARTVPEALPGASGPLRSDALTVARQLLPAARIPWEGRVRERARLQFEGLRLLTEAELRDFEVQEGSGRRSAPGSTDLRMPVVQALLPFANAVGSREVEVELEGRHVRGEAEPRWRVVAATTLEPSEPPEAMEDIAREYRAMQEDILRHWRQEVKDSARLAGVWSFEQLAYWYVGGFIAKGALGAMEAAAPTVVSVLGRGGAKAAQWFRTVLIRTPPAEREALQRIWMKAEAEGLAALEAGEQAELRHILAQVEKALHEPLDRQAKKRLRQWARREYFETVNPQLARELGPLRMEEYEIHHRVPLEYARLFPRMDINQGTNLVAVERTVHRSINRVWESVGQQSQRLDSRQVEELSRVIDQQYGSWFHRVHVPAESASALAAAEQNALRAVKALLER
ncbi:hypothetical protein HMI49_06790 [Corallococcus exercitus]|uniref:Uncharacterized protein n=1 Tax=Corallococcus exercitus TaxID=2316736 RepID=A0A7Y4NR88_9BACT|nr:hypothetical protein [Corallococcus exercitus]NOK32903.1 hypothetical protein [Corallococcus exercitus]